MSRTLIDGLDQIQGGTISRADLCTATSGSAVIAKIIAGAGLSISSTGADAGTGDVTISLSSVSTALLSGTLAAAQAPAFSGDMTTSAGSLATTVSKIGGKAVSLGGALTTSGAFGLTLTLTAATTLTLPTSGTVTAQGNAVTGSGSIVLASAPTLSAPVLGTPASGTLTHCTGLPIAGLTGLGTGIATALAAAAVGSGSIVLSSGVPSSILGGVASVAALRALSTASWTQPFCVVTSFYSGAGKGGGTYIYDATDTTSTDNGGTILVDASTRRWKLLHDGRVSIAQFGAKIDGSTDDSAVINAAILVAGAQGFTLTAPAGTCCIASTINFPATLPSGFVFAAEPGFAFKYSGAGDAVNIASNTNSYFTFGSFAATVVGAIAIHLQPNGNSTTGQNAIVVCQINFNAINGFQTGIYADCNAGNIAQCQINGLLINTGANSASYQFATTSYGIRADGIATAIYQGNEFHVNYILTTAAAHTSNAPWIGIQDGSATLGTVANNVNTYTYGAIDGVSYGYSFGVVTFGMRNYFNGPIVDIHICVQLGSCAYFIFIYASSLSTNGLAGDYQIFDNSTDTSGSWHWNWLGSGGGNFGAVVAGAPGFGGDGAACVFNGVTGTLMSRLQNISSITRNSVGNYTLQFQEPMSISDYAVALSINDLGHAYVFSATTLTLQVRTTDLSGTPKDFSYICVSCSGGGGAVIV